MRLEEHINQHYAALNENDYLILRYIMQHRVECRTISITKLAEVCAISVASIVRFTQKLGFAGYSEFKYCLKQDTPDIIIQQNSFETMQTDMNATMELLKETDFKDIIDKIKHANRIFCYGSGYSQRLMLKEFNHCMVNCNKNIFLIPAKHELENQMFYLNEDDLIIIASYSGNISDYSDCIHGLKLLNVPILSITNFTDNELARNASHHLYYKTTPSLGLVGTRHQRVTYLTLHLVLETLYRAYYENIMKK